MKFIYLKKQKAGKIFVHTMKTYGYYYSFKKSIRKTQGSQGK